MGCSLCNWLADRLGVPDDARYCLWDQVVRWEADYSQKWETYDDNEVRRLRAHAAAELVEIDPEAALREFVELAEMGSAWSMRWAGHLYTGTNGIERNAYLAEEYFRQAICAGSWSATLDYVSILYKRGAHDSWPRTLDGGVKLGFVPSFYWQARNHYRLSPTGKTARAMRPLLEHAAKAGHPGAKVLLAKLAMQADLG